MSHAYHHFTEPTLDPDWRRCRFSGCRETKRIAITRPAPAVVGSETSEAAARKIEWERRHFRQRVWDGFVAVGDAGYTDEEGATTLNINPSTYRPRRVELWRDNLIEQRSTRKTRAGRDAAVWVRRT